MRNRDTLNGQLLEFTPGVLPTGSYTRNTFATYFIDREWQATLRGRFGYAFDRLLVYATGGLAVTSLKTGGNYTFQTIIGPALAPFPGAPPQNFSAPGVGSSQDYLGVTFGGGIEYALTNNWSLGAEYRFADFGKRNVTLVIAPAAGVLLPAMPVEMPVSLFSQQATARLNYRFGGPEMATKSVALPGTRGEQLERLLRRRLRGRRLEPRSGGYVRSLDQRPAGVRPAAAAPDHVLRLERRRVRQRPRRTATISPPAAWAAARSAVTGSLPRRASSGASRPKPASCA